MPGDPDRVYASMGNYVFSTQTLLRELYADAANENSSHDFGRDILPDLIGRSPMYAYDFQTNVIEGDPPGHDVYWRDVGTIDAYYDASMDLRQVSPVLNLYNQQWPLRTASYSSPPAKFTFDEEGRRGQADGFHCRRRQYLVGRHREAVGAWTGRARAHGRAGGRFDYLRQLRYRPAGEDRGAILDKNVRVPEDAMIGYDLQKDALFHHVTETGIVVVEGHRSMVEVSSIET